MSLLAMGASSVVAVPSVTADAANDATSRPSLTCQGEKATVVGQPGSRSVRGTPGPDVIVSNGATVVVAGKGADLVCVTRSRGKRIAVDAGAGADRVVVRGRATVTAVLGAGRDVYRGGPGRDSANSIGGSRDLVTTGEGPDAVFAGSSDVVGLGVGDDQYVLFAQTMSPRGRLTGGPGRDELNTREELVGDVVLDARRGTGTTDGVASFRFDDMEVYYVDTGDSGSLDFRGTSSPEELRTARSRVVTAQLGGGDDRAGGVFFSDSTTDYRGGAGDDVLGFFLEDDSTVDLGTGTVGLPASPVARFAGFESYEPRGFQVDVTGSAGPDTVTAYACELSVRGGAGNDVLRIFEPSFDDFCSAGSVVAEVYGEEDDDILGGNRFDDLLDGGTGNDRTDGRDGSDVCVAETRVRCEA